MAKRNDKQVAKSKTATADTMEQRVLAFAEQLGRMAGTIQATAENWMDRERLKKQIAGVRDDAARLLQQLATEATDGLHGSPGSGVVDGRNKGRSGGRVDAPGKKHRTPGPTDPDANILDSQAAKMRSAKTMVKTNRRRGRG